MGDHDGRNPHPFMPTFVAAYAPSDRVARYGGEELVVILPHTTLEGARVAAERLRVEITRAPMAEPFVVATRPLHVSIGAAMLHGAETTTALLARADERHYAAKGADEIASRPDVTRPRRWRN